MQGAEPAGQGVRKVVVAADDAGQRIDNYVQRVSGGLPRSRLYRIIRKGELRVNGKRVKPEYRVQPDDIVRLPPMFVAEKTEAAASPRLRQLLAASVLYEDNTVLVLNKPAGLAVHGGSGVTTGLIEALRQLRPEDNTLELVHRLDRETSGCLLIAKKRSVLRRLHADLRDGRFHKRYLALVSGTWRKDLREINAPLQKNQLAGGERYVKVAAGGRRSVTQFTVLKSTTHASLLEVELLTGRTHQIRVHTQYAGHPIVGDDKYGTAAINAAFRAQGAKRLYLHAAGLSFVSPATDKRLTVTAPLDAASTAFITAVVGDW